MIVRAFGDEAHGLCEIVSKEIGSPVFIYIALHTAARRVVPAGEDAREAVLRCLEALRRSAELKTSRGLATESTSRNI